MTPETEAKQGGSPWDRLRRDLLGEPGHPWPLQALRLVVALASLYFIVIFYALAIARLQYPYDIEWMEGGMLTHALRFFEGKHIYVEPSVDFIPYLYTPLYPALLSLLFHLVEPSYFVARLVSLVAISVAAWALHRMVSRETSSSYYGLLGVGLFLGAFDFCGGWYDLARNDSLYLGMDMLALYLVRYHHRRWPLLLLSAVLLGLGFFAKQVTVVYMPLAGLFLWFCSGKLRAVGYAAVVGAIDILGMAWLNRATEGWFWTYIFDFHQNHHFDWNNPLWRFEWRTFQFIPLALIAIVAWLCYRARTRKERSGQFPFAVVLILSSIAITAINVGTQWYYHNAYMPTILGCAMALGLLSHDLLHRLRSSAQWGVSLTLAFYLLLLGQMAWIYYDPSEHWPTAEDRAAGDEFMRKMATIQGEILIPYHPFYTYQLNKTIHFHRMGVGDVLATGYLGYPKGIKEGVKARRWAAIVLDEASFLPSLSRFYSLEEKIKYSDEAFKTRTGFPSRPLYIHVPKRVTGNKFQGISTNFEEGRYVGWTPTGEAFGKKPAKGGLRGQNPISNFEGKYLANTFVDGDRARGRLTSKPFVITYPDMSFLIGGGNLPGKVGVRLLVDGKEVLSATGKDDEAMERVTWDVSAHVGKTAVLELFDEFSGSWGHILFDDIRF